MISLATLFGVCLVYVVLAFLVLFNNPKALLNRVYAALVFIIPAWSIVVYFEDVQAVAGYINPLVRLDYLLASCMLALFYWFCALIAPRRWVVADAAVGSLWAISTLFAAAGFLAVVTYNNEDIILSPNTGFPVFVSYLLITLGGGFGRLYWKFSRSQAKERAQITFVAAGLLCTITALVFAVIVAPRVFGFSGADVTRLGLYSTLFFAGFSAYAILKHRFMDIRLLVVRSVVYLLLLIAMATIYTVIVLQIGRVFFDVETGSFAHNVYNLLLALLLAFTFQPLRRFFERVTSKVFYKNAYDSQHVLNEFSKLLASEIQLDRLLKHSITKFCRDLRIETGQLVVLKDGQIFRLGSYGKIPEWTRQGKMPRVGRGLKISDELDLTVERELLKESGARVTLELVTQEGTIGYLFLGDKLSGDIYSSQDIRLLEIVGKELAVAVTNARAYAEIQAFNQTLQRKVREATQELRLKNRRLKALDKAKDEFISTASHQMRTPLTSIKGYISMVLEGQGGPLNTEQKKLLAEAYNGSQRMVFLIADFLSLSRIRTDKFTIQPRPTQLLDVIQEEVGRLQATAHNRGLKLRYQAPESFPELMLDEEKIRQVVMNLIDNAIYYTKDGGTVTVLLIATNKEVVFKVQDTGVGVPKADQHQLFTKFFRASNALKMRPDGTGIGLFLVRKIIALHGGAMIFESKEHKGSTFGFRFPLNDKILVHDGVGDPAHQQGDTAK